MKIHTVREPFLCRVSQFEPDKRNLCIGLDYQTLKKNPEFWCYLGKNKKSHYEIESAKALEVGQQWVNPRGRTVIIIPLSFFKCVVVTLKVDEDKEHKRAISIAQAELKL